MFFSREARKDLDFPLESGTPFRVPQNFTIGENFPDEALYAGRAGTFYSYLKREFLRYGFNSLGFILIMKQEDYEKWGAMEDYIREEIARQVREIGEKLGREINTNRHSVTVLSEATLLSVFSARGISVESTYDFLPGEFVMIAGPFLYREGTETVGEVRGEVEGRVLEGKLYLGQSFFVVGEEWFYNLWIPSTGIGRLKIPLIFSIKEDKVKLSNIQGKGNGFTALVNGITVAVEREDLKEGTTYRVAFSREDFSLEVSLDFRLHRPLAESPGIDLPEEVSIYEDLTARSEDLSLQYILLPKPTGPLREYQAFVGPQGEVFDEKLLTCLGVKVDSSSVEIKDFRIPHYRSFHREFPVGDFTYRAGTVKLSEKLWGTGNRYFLFEIELPRPRPLYLEENLAMVGRDPSCHIRLPSAASRDFRTIHSSRFHAVFLREDGDLYVINISAHFKVYVFRGERLIQIPHFGQEVYRKIKRLSLRENSLSHILELLSSGGKVPAFLRLQPEDLVLVGNSVFKVPGE